MKTILTIEVDEAGVIRLVNIMGPGIELPPYLKKTVVSSNEPQAPETAPQPAPAADAGPVKLDPKDPEFETQKKDLKKKGFRYMGQHKAWYPPRENQAKSEKQLKSNHQFENWWGSARFVGLLKDDTDFDKKRTALKRAGFKWNKPLSLWENPQATQ